MELVEIGLPWRSVLPGLQTMPSRVARFHAIVAGCLLFLGAIPADGQFSKRCGWFDNPTPANASLYDRDGEWIIAVQGGHQAEGNWPAFKPSQWVEVNGHYGYGCACLQVNANPKTREVLDIKSASPRPLATCRQDRSLEKWKQMFK